jgi:hypothetical protein
MTGTIESTTGPEAICVQCFARFPISREEARWIEEDGARVLCPDCYHEATGVDVFNGED